MFVLALSGITRRQFALWAACTLWGGKRALAQDRLLEVPRVERVSSNGIFERPTKTIPTYQITSHIDDPKEIPFKNALSYFILNTEMPLEIVRYRDGKFGPAYRESDLQNNLHFQTGNGGRPLAIIEPGDSGFPYGLELYHIDDHPGCSKHHSGVFCVHKNLEIRSSTLSPLIEIPTHTHVSSDHLLNIQQPVGDLPPEISGFLTKEEFKLILGYNSEAAYYKTWPAFETQDGQHVRHQSGRGLVKTQKGKWQSYYKCSEAAGIYHENKAAIPEWHHKFNSKEYQKLLPVITKEVVFHEIGHKLNRNGHNDNSPKFSDSKEFKKACEEDIKAMTEENENHVAYMLTNENEAFAELTGILMGGFREDWTRFKLSVFPTTAKYIAEILENHYGFKPKINWAEVRRNQIYKIALGNDQFSFVPC